MTRRRRRVLFVGGGTVGHLAPGFAVATLLRRRGLVATFATPGEPGEAAWFPDEESAPQKAPAIRLPRRGHHLPPFALRLGRAVFDAHALLRRLDPGIVVALGGWPCVPVALAARLARTPLVLFASDRSPGVAVRRLAPLASRIYVAAAEAQAAFSDPSRVVVTGPILRRDAIEGVADPERFGLEPGRRTLLVTGGSLGALALNRGVAEGLRDVLRESPERAARIQVLHSVGRSGEGVREAYAAAGIPHHVTPFLRRVGDAYALADLVVARAGAMTCAELEATGTPAVLVPYPHHADRQQYENARPLVERGGAHLLDEKDLDADAVRDVIVALLEDDGRRHGMGRAMRAGRQDGAAQITDDLIRLICRRPAR